MIMAAIICMKSFVTKDDITAAVATLSEVARLESASSTVLSCNRSFESSLVQMKLLKFEEKITHTARNSIGIWSVDSAVSWRSGAFGPGLLFSSRFSVAALLTASFIIDVFNPRVSSFKY